MIDVIYYWSEDGVAERCKLDYGTADKDTRCYHCDGTIGRGRAVAQLFPRTGEPYLLHKECAEKACNFKPIKRIRPDKRLSDYINKG